MNQPSMRVLVEIAASVQASMQSLSKGTLEYRYALMSWGMGSSDLEDRGLHADTQPLDGTEEYPHLCRITFYFDPLRQRFRLTHIMPSKLRFSPLPLEIAILSDAVDAALYGASRRNKP